MLLLVCEQGVGESGIIRYKWVDQGVNRLQKFRLCDAIICWHFYHAQSVSVIS